MELGELGERMALDYLIDYEGYAGEAMAIGERSLLNLTIVRTMKRLFLLVVLSAACGAEMATGWAGVTRPLPSQKKNPGISRSYVGKLARKSTKNSRMCTPSQPVNTGILG